MTRTAAALFVHPNTVKQRLQRVTSLIGDGWRSPEDQFRLGVALRIHRLSSHPGTEAGGSHMRPT